MDNNNEFFSGIENNENTINLRDELDKYLQYWRLFVVSAVIFLILAFLYLRYTTPVYLAKGEILIKDNKNALIRASGYASKSLNYLIEKQTNQGLKQVA